MSIFLGILFVVCGLIVLSHRHDQIRTGQRKAKWYDKI